MFCENMFINNRKVQCNHGKDDTKGAYLTNCLYVRNEKLLMLSANYINTLFFFFIFVSASMHKCIIVLFA